MARDWEGYTTHTVQSRLQDLFICFYGRLEGFREYEGKMSFGKRIFLKNSQEQMGLCGAKTFFGFEFGGFRGSAFVQFNTIGTIRLVSGKHGCFSSSLLFHDTIQGDRIFRAYFKWNDFLREFAEEGDYVFNFVKDFGPGCRVCK